MKTYFMYFFGILIPALIIVFSGALTYNFAYDEPDEIIIEYTQDDAYERIYESRLKKLKFYSIGDIVTEQELMNFEFNKGKYAIWFDVHKKVGNSCLYEIKGLHNTTEDNASAMGWRFYIKTENNRIISIRRG